MAIRTPRGYERNRPYFQELCEGVRPNSQALPREVYTGLPHVRVDEHHHDPIVVDPGTIVGMITGGNAIGAGKLCPAVMGSGALDTHTISGIGAANSWGLPAGAVSLAVGRVKPLGIVYRPIYSFYLDAAYTNYKRVSSVGILTDYVVMLPASNADEVAIEAGDVVMLGRGKHYGIGLTTPHTTQKQAGRYAKLDTTLDDWMERTVGRCLKKTLLGNISGASAGDLLADNLSSFTAAASAVKEFGDIDMVQTVPGLGLSGSETKGIPAFLLGARADGDGNVWALTMLIRL